MYLKFVYTNTCAFSTYIFLVVLECGCCDPTPCLVYSREAALVLFSEFCSFLLVCLFVCFSWKQGERLMLTVHFTLMYGQAFRPLSLGLFTSLSVLLDWSYRAVNELGHIPGYSILFLLSRQFVLPVFVYDIGQPAACFLYLWNCVQKRLLTSYYFCIAFW